MLSRLAESLYWMGRHLERADCTARMLDVYLTFQQRPGAGGDQVVGFLRQTYADTRASMSGGPQGDPADLLPDGVEPLVFDLVVPSAVSGALAAARENARSVRDYLPPNVWRSLNVTWHRLRGDSVGRPGMHGFLRWVTERCALTCGTADDSMSHDEGWQFWAVGRALERADLTIRMLLAERPDSWTGATARAAVNAIGGWTSFSRSNRTLHTTTSAFDFVLLDEDFPRSVLVALRDAERALTALETYHPAQTGRREPALRAAARARAMLEYRTTPRSAAEITRLLEALLLSLDAVHNTLRANHFALDLPQWGVATEDIAAPRSTGQASAARPGAPAAAS